MAVFLLVADLAIGLQLDSAPAYGVSMATYRLKAGIPAILDQSESRTLPVMLPAGAVLRDSSQASTTVLGMIGVWWEGRHYSVSLKDLLNKAGRVFLV